MRAKIFGMPICEQMIRPNDTKKFVGNMVTEYGWHINRHKKQDGSSIIGYASNPPSAKKIKSVISE